jgi:hypothetical protein
MRPSFAVLPHRRKATNHLNWPIAGFNDDGGSFGVSTSSQLLEQLAAVTLQAIGAIEQNIANGAIVRRVYTTVLGASFPPLICCVRALPTFSANR